MTNQNGVISSIKVINDTLFKVSNYLKRYHNNLSHRKKVKFKKLRIILPVSYSETN